MRPVAHGRYSLSGGANFTPLAGGQTEQAYSPPLFMGRPRDLRAVTTWWLCGSFTLGTQASYGSMSLMKTIRIVLACIKHVVCFVALLLMLPFALAMDR